MQLITLDIETYFADDYTLSKMTTESYVRDPRFKVHCVGLKQEAVTDCVNDETFRNRMYGIATKALLCQHSHFDGLILSHHYGITPAFWFDTLSMARLVFTHAKSHSLASLARMLGLPQKTVPYSDFKNVRDLPPELYNKVAAGCMNDVELTYQVFQKLLPYVPKDELRIIDLTVRMFTEPALRLDRDKLQQHLRGTKDAKDTILDDLQVTKEELGSSEKFAALLQSLGVEPPTKVSKKTGKVGYAFAKTDSGMKALLDHENDTVARLTAARLGVKSNIIETRGQRMLDMDARGAMAVYLKYCGATKTTRWSGGDKMNWQNFKRGSVLRDAIMAPPGYAVVVVDASQIECRLLNFVAGQDDMLEKFRRKEDIYSEIASQFYKEPVDKSKPDKRGTGKQIILSCGYRAGEESIKNTARIGLYGPPVHLTIEQAKEAKELYRRTHPKVKQFWQYCDDVLLPALYEGDKQFKFGPNDILEVVGKNIKLPNGVYLQYNNLHPAPMKWNKRQWCTVSPKGVAGMHGGILTQNIIEGLSRAVLCNFLLQVAKKYKVVTCTHDEGVYLAPWDEAEEAFQWGLQIMKTPPWWCAGIPLDAEGGWAVNYSK